MKQKFFILNLTGIDKDKTSSNILIHKIKGQHQSQLKMNFFSPLWSYKNVF